MRVQKNSLNILKKRRKEDKTRINLKKKRHFFRDIVNSEISNLIICHSIANDVNAVAMLKTQQREGIADAINLNFNASVNKKFTRFNPFCDDIRNFAFNQDERKWHL